MKKIFYIFIAFIGFALCSNNTVKAQTGVAINATGANADPSAGLDVDFDNMGVLLPRMSTSARGNIANPANGLTIFNTDCNTYNYNTGTPSSPLWTTLSANNVLVAGVSITSNPAGTVCGSATYTATPASGITPATYQWQVNGVNGSGSSNIATYTYTPGNGDLVTCIITSVQNCVTGSPATSNTITVNASTVPATPGSITGASSPVCTSGPSNGDNFSVGTVTGATYYNWILPPGGTITGGTGTASITANFTNPTTGNISVTASNDCGTSAASSEPFAVAVSSLSSPTISGPSAVFNNASGIGYSVNPPVSGATSYNWTVPSGATVTQGQGTDTITVSFSTNAGNVSVTAANACTSSSSNLYVSPCTPEGSGYSQSFSYSSNTYQTFTVPCTDTIKIQCWGASQSSYNLQGGYAQGTLAVTPGETLYIFVGQNGSAGGWNGGGQSYTTGYDGGGETDVRVGGTNISNWVIVAGGCGGSSNCYGGGFGGSTYLGGTVCGTSCGGGAGGGQCNSGSNGTCAGGNGGTYGCSSCYGNGGGGGGANSGGDGAYNYWSYYGSGGSVNNGTQQNGAAENSYPANNAGGGGGGYWGGGGGSSGNSCCGGAGGGGSSWVSPSMTNISFYGYNQSAESYYNGQGVAGNGYNGYVILTW